MNLFHGPLLSSHFLRLSFLLSVFLDNFFCNSFSRLYPEASRELLLVQISILAQDEVARETLAFILDLEQRSAGQVPLLQAPLWVQTFLLSFFSCLWVLRIEDTSAVEVYRWSVSA